MSKLRKHDHTLDGSDWDLSLLGLKEAPVDDLRRNPMACRIDLSNNALTELAPSFTSLTHLIELDLSKNRLNSLPQSFGQLSKLVRLDLYSNQLKTLPLSFGQLTRLKWLDLKDNPLEPLLAKNAGDCVDQRQCQLCATRCVKFMSAEKLRIDAEMKNKDEQMRQRLENERQLEDKKRKEKEKKKAKNARRSARKTRNSSADDNGDDGDVGDEDSDSGDTRGNKSGHKSWATSLLIAVLRLLIIISLVLMVLFICLSIGLHLQNGHKLETMADIKTSVIDCFAKTQNWRQLAKESTLLIENMVKGMKNWRNSLDMIYGKQNATKS